MPGDRKSTKRARHCTVRVWSRRSIAVLVTRRVQSSHLPFFSLYAGNVSATSLQVGRAQSREACKSSLLCNLAAVHKGAHCIWVSLHSLTSVAFAMNASYRDDAKCGRWLV